MRDSENVDITEDYLAGLSWPELNELSSELSEDMARIQTQIEAWHFDNPGEPHNEWRFRAGIALRWKSRHRSLVRATICIRRQEMEQAKAREKAARIERSRANTAQHCVAFYEAAKKYLPLEVRLQVWSLAKELYPEAFAGGMGH